MIITTFVICSLFVSSFLPFFPANPLQCICAICMRTVSVSVSPSISVSVVCLSVSVRIYSSPHQFLAHQSQNIFHFKSQFWFGSCIVVVVVVVALRAKEWESEDDGSVESWEKIIPGCSFVRWDPHTLYPTTILTLPPATQLLPVL